MDKFINNLAYEASAGIGLDNGGIISIAIT
jgi:hypothetical protein